MKRIPFFTIMYKNLKPYQITRKGINKLNSWIETSYDHNFGIAHHQVSCIMMINGKPT